MYVNVYYGCISAFSYGMQFYYSKNHFTFSSEHRRNDIARNHYFHSDCVENSSFFFIFRLSFLCTVSFVFIYLSLYIKPSAGKVFFKSGFSFSFLVFRTSLQDRFENTETEFINFCQFFTFPVFYPIISDESLFYVICFRLPFFFREISFILLVYTRKGETNRSLFKSAIMANTKKIKYKTTNSYMPKII